MIRATMGTSSRPNHMPSLLDAFLPMLCDDLRASCIASRNRLRPRLRVFASRVDFGAILKGLGKPKRRSKSILGRFVSDVFFNCASASFWGRFLEGRTFKNQ